MTLTHFVGGSGSKTKLRLFRRPGPPFPVEISWLGGFGRPRIRGAWAFLRCRSGILCCLRENTGAFLESLSEHGLI